MAALESGCWQSAGYVDNGASCHYVRRILKPHRVVLLCLLSRWWQATLCIRSATGPRLLSAHLIIRKSSARCRYTPLPPPLSLFPLSLLYIFPLSLSLSVQFHARIPSLSTRCSSLPSSREIPSLAQGLASSTCNSALVRTASLACHQLSRKREREGGVGRRLLQLNLGTPQFFEFAQSDTRWQHLTVFRILFFVCSSCLFGLIEVAKSICRLVLQLICAELLRWKYFYEVN